MTNPRINEDHFGRSAGEVQAALDDVRRRDVVGRIWRRDHTLWKPDPSEISNRLGWLTVAGQMGEQTPDLLRFADDVRSSGYQHVVLLGMGGSSLGPEVLARTFNGSYDRFSGLPRLIVLDSTVPGRVATVTRAIDPAKTMFLVSSKSGGTVETLSFYLYFRDLVDRAVGRREAGRNFAAITDPGTSLEKLAEEEHFRRVFANPADIGGRYSVLSYFGLVPGALIGVKVTRLLERAAAMAVECSSGVAAEQNPGALLGAAIAGFARAGRNKLTLVTSDFPSKPAGEGWGSGFALWVEQLIAESLGKEGAGIIPVTVEPLAPPARYGQDRWFVYLRGDWDDAGHSDEKMAEIQSVGHPVLTFRLGSPYDLGAEFFRWQFAVAVAGALMGVNPFDQPDVQRSKDNTDRALDFYQGEGRGEGRAEVRTEGRGEGALPPLAEFGSAEGLLDGAKPGDYLAIMAFIEQTVETDALLARLRSRVLAQTGIATTLGYGPRFLHSTGQLHKGGPPGGLFLQLVSYAEAGGAGTGTPGTSPDLEIPGAEYTFGALAQAQAMGDMNALTAMGRRTARVNLGIEPAAGLEKILRGLE